MTQKFCYFIIILVIIITSCNTNTSDFSHHEKKIYGELLDIDCLIGRPSEIVCIDSLLLLYDRFENQTITVIDKKNNQFVRRFLSEGQGPDEVIVPLKLFVSPQENKLFVFQIQTGYLYEYNLKNIADKDASIVISGKYHFEDRPANLRKTKSGFVGIGLFDDGRFRFYSQNGEYRFAAGKYPFLGDKMAPDARFFVYQGFLCSNPDGNDFAIGSCYCDNLEFYRCDEKETSLVKKYESYDANVQYDQRMVINDDCIMNYKWAYGSNKYCYMLYSGQTYGENDRKTFGGKKIIVFDWHGNYIKSFETDRIILSFCVDEVDGKIYAITNDKVDNSIIQFTIEI